jgi:hypothetical protein
MNHQTFLGIIGAIMVITGASIGSWGMVAIGCLIFITIIFK